jgi:hypothetical protein
MLRLLGPTVDYLGEETKNTVAKQKENLGRIFAKSEYLLGDKINRSGQVSPRVLKHIWDEGRFVEDELTAQYFGGILASSRSEESRDDRALTYINIVKSMSTYQIRFHYALYSLARSFFIDSSLKCGSDDDINKMRLFIPFHIYHNFMDFSENENSFEILSHILLGLSRLELIDPYFASASQNQLSEFFPDVKVRGLVVNISIYGIDLYFQVHGFSNCGINDFLNPDIHFKNEIPFDFSFEEIIQV